MKYHSGGGKIKYQHRMIKGLRKFLEGIESWEEIQTIIPGRIKRARPQHEIVLSVQYKTESGLKCLAKSGSEVQEVFIVTSFPDRVKERLEQVDC